ncbi:MAG: hypothetical protein Q8O25_13730 [Sulfurisoma sp.]|nr:hypothetical protein [Sulfurisoma sp.]
MSERATQHRQAQQNFHGLGDDAFLAGPVHRLGDDLADVGVGVGGNTTGWGAKRQLALPIEYSGAYNSPAQTSAGIVEVARIGGSPQGLDTRTWGLCS